MPLPERPSDRQPYGGDVKRDRPLLEQGPIGPLGARIRVVPIRVETHLAAVLFQVEAEWTGPGLPELPPAPGPVEAREVYAIGDLELAKATAQAAVDELRAGRLPALRELAERLERRRQ
jgi:hypothetical protein